MFLQVFLSVLGFSGMIIPAALARAFRMIQDTRSLRLCGSAVEARNRANQFESKECKETLASWKIDMRGKEKG